MDFLDTPQKKLVEEKADSLNEPGILRGSNLGGGDVVEQQKKEEVRKSYFYGLINLFKRYLF